MHLQDDFENNSEHFNLRGELMQLARIIDERVPYDKIVERSLPKKLENLNKEVGDFRYPNILVTKTDDFIIVRLAYLKQACLKQLESKSGLDQISGEYIVRDTLVLIEKTTSKILKSLLDKRNRQE